MSQSNARVGCIYRTLQADCVYRYTTGVGIDIRFICCMVFGDTTSLMNEIGSHVLYCIYSPHRGPMAQKKRSAAYLWMQTSRTYTSGNSYNRRWRNGPHLLGVCTYDSLCTHLVIQHLQQQKHRYGTSVADIQGAGLRFYQRSILEEQTS